MSDFPLVSVLMTCYNREEFIAEAIQSVLDSTYTNIELIIVDDQSSDHTVEIVKSFEAKDKRIRFYVNDVNLGQFHNRNKAASLAKGMYLMHADSDDLIYKNGVEICMKAMLEYPHAGFGMYYDDLIDQTPLLKSNEAIFKHFFKKPFLTRGPGGTIIKNEIFRKIGGFPVNYGPAGDMYYNLNAAANTDVLLLPFEFMFYRRHEGQEINNPYGYLINNYCYLRDALKEINFLLTRKELEFISNKNKRRFIVNLFKYLIKTRNIAEVRNAVEQAEFSMKDFTTAVFH